MVFFNYALRKLNAKIVYYGPGLCGKTTNLQWIHDNFEGGDKGKMVSLATEGDRTIFFDLLPLDIGKIRGMDVTLQLYTVPGQVHYNSTRQLVLRGADGVVFVADSQGAMQSSNADSLKNLDENLGLQGVNLEEFPHVIQFNKRDLGGLMGVEEMDAALNRFDAPFFEAVAVEGIGVQETLEGIVRLVMRSLKGRYESRGLNVEPSSRLKPATEAGPWSSPAAQPAEEPRSGIRPLTATPSPPPPQAAAEGPSEFSSAPEKAGYENEMNPEAVSFDEPPAFEASQSETDDPFGAALVSDDEPGPANADTEFDQPAFDAPAIDVGPPAGSEGEIFEELEPVAFEDIDTQTDLLVPSLITPGLGDFGAEAADLMPSGPGKPVESDDDNVSVAQYDTADVEEFQRSASAGGVEQLDEGSAEIDGAETAEPEASYSDDLPVTAAGSPFARSGDPSYEESAPEYDVDSLVASVLGDEERGEAVGGDQFDDGFEAPDSAGHPETIEEDQAAEEVEQEQSAEDEFESDSGPVFETAQQPFSQEASVESAEADFAPTVEHDVPEVFQVPAGDADETVAVDEGEQAEEETEAFGAIDNDVVEPPSYRSPMAPVVFDESDPFGDDAWDGAPVGQTPAPAVERAVDQSAGAGVLLSPEENHLPVSVSAADNSLALKLTGTGAIIESGQVRELDIEVPVPGDWVGNRRVTLQLRLTLSPVAEDENDGSNNPA